MKVKNKKVLYGIIISLIVIVSAWILVFIADYVLVAKIHSDPIFVIKVYENKIDSEDSHYYEKRFQGIGYSYYIREINNENKQLFKDYDEKFLAYYELEIFNKKIKTVSIGINK